MNEIKVEEIMLLASISKSNIVPELYALFPNVNINSKLLWIKNRQSMLDQGYIKKESDSIIVNSEILKRLEVLNKPDKIVQVISSDGSAISLLFKDDTNYIVRIVGEELIIEIDKINIHNFSEFLDLPMPSEIEMDEMTISRQVLSNIIRHIGHDITQIREELLFLADLKRTLFFYYHDLIKNKKHYINILDLNRNSIQYIREKESCRLQKYEEKDIYTIMEGCVSNG